MLTAIAIAFARHRLAADGEGHRFPPHPSGANTNAPANDRHKPSVKTNGGRS
jgi:hypothetical protein